MWLAANDNRSGPRLFTPNHSPDAERQGESDIGSVRRTNAIDDPDLLQRLRSGEDAAYDTVYFECVAPLVRFEYSYLESMAAAEDVVADTFVHLWERRADLAPRFGLRAYLFAAVHNRVRHALRGEGRRARMTERLATALVGEATDSVPVEKAMDTTTLEAKLRRAVEALSADRRRLIALRWYEELSVPEIAEVLGLSVGSVKQRLLRTLDALRRLLDEKS